MRRSLFFFGRARFARLIGLTTAVVATLCLPQPATAQLSRLGGSIGALEPGMTMRGTDTAYDPQNDVYLLVVGYGPIYGVFVNSAGNPVTAPFTIMAGDLGFGHFPRAKYSPHVSNGVGGSGGFLVTWNHNVGIPNYVFGRIVSYNSPGRLVTGIQQISDGHEGGVWHETGPAMAYSMNGRFLVAWRTLHYGIRGRFVDASGTPFGGAMQFENAGGSRDPGLAWNPATDEFGLVYTGFGNGGAFTSFRRIRAADGTVSPRSTFGHAAGTFATAIDVNTATNNYVMVWALHPGTMSATFDPHGNLLGTNYITGRFGFDQALGLAFNNVTGTFLAVGSDGASAEVAAAEVSGGGGPNSGVHVITDGAGLGSYHPMTASRRNTNQWSVVYSRDFRGATSQIVASSTTGGGAGSAPPPPTPAPPPPTGGCSTPDPFVAIGGGTCVNGGWVPGGSSPAPPPPAPAPAPPPPASSGCSTPDPFVSIGGGTCVNGGWIPGAPSTPPPPPPVSAPPPPPPSSCSTPDPFAAIGGGTCVNGGWVPGTSSGSSCSTPDPFVSLGGGICQNGGWIPKTILCVGPDPFVSLGGGVCIGTGWVPRGF